MRWPQNVTSLLILVMLLAFPFGLSAQMNWAQVATPSTIGLTIVHTIDAADGIILVGGSGVSISTDRGSTWRNITPNITNNPNFVGIAIYDRNIFAVQSGTSGIYITHDQGMTWRPLLFGSTVIPEFPLLFLNDPDKILTTTDGAFIYTSDGGNTFRTSATTLYPYQLKLAANGTVRLFSRTDDDVRTASSSDTGRTWVESTILPYKDCFSIVTDPVNPNILCLINEDFYLQQHECMIFRTSDNGSTWDTTLTHALTYLAGSSDRGCSDYFVGTVSDGILRSTDQGLTWHGIGGPSVPPDYRNLVAADDSLLFAIDLNQAVWRTSPVTHTWKIKLRNNLLFSSGANVTCDSVRTGMVIIYPSCSNAGAQRADISGPDAQYYDFLDSVDASFPDTIKVRFTSSMPGTRVASLKIILTDGSEHTFDISTTTIAPDITYSPFELMKDSVTFCEALSDTLKIASPCPMSISSIALVGLDSASFTIVGPSTRSLPQDSNIIVVCNPKRLGLLDAQLRITTQYGGVHFVFLRPSINRIQLAVIFDTIWARDSLWQCQSGRDTIRIRSGCSVSNIDIALTDSSNYRILGKRNISLSQDSIIIVEYFSNGRTDISSYLTFRSPILDSVNVPLRRTFKRAAITIKNTPRIFADTFSFCKEVIDTVIFTSNCPHTATNVHFEGPDAAKFKIIGRSTLQLPSDSAIIISCTTNQPGQLNADLVFDSEDKFNNRYRLQPVFITSPFRLQPSALFVGDSIGACVGGFDTVHFASDCPLKIKRITLSGTDAASFKLSSIAPLQLPNDSVIIVECLPGAKGRRLAVLQIELEDGRTWSVSLSALIVDAPIKITPAALFTKDTVSQCSFALDTIRLFAPCPFSLKGATIQGADAGLFQLEGNSPANLPQDSLVVIRFTPNGSGPVAAYLRLEATDGRVWTLPFSPTVVESHLQFNKASLFDGDTISACSSSRDSIVISADCPITITSLNVIGNDASSFAIAGAGSLVLPKDSNVTLICTPVRNGQLDASLQVISQDGRTWTIPMSVFATQAPVTLSTNSLFDGDSLYSCSTINDTLDLASQCATDIVDISFSGNDAASFTANHSQLLISGDTTLIVTCIPDHAGPLNATLHLRSSDGRTWDVDLSAISTLSPLTVSHTSLFELDAFTLCETSTDTLHLRTLCPLDIVSATITGSDQASFSVANTQLSLPQDSVLVVDCDPLRTGKLDAKVTITTADGRIVEIALAPTIIDRTTVSLSTIADVATDTLGGDILIPISITRTIGKGDIAFTLRFDEATLEYVGVFDMNGTDKTVSHTSGVARVTAEVEGTTELVAKYQYFPADNDCTTIRIDSISTSQDLTSCLTNLTEAVTINVCATGFCGRDIITSFLRQGSQFNFSITPNPSNGDILLRSDNTSNGITVEIIDGLGIVRRSLHDVQLSQAGVKIATTELASGIYLVRVSNGISQGTARLTLIK